MIYLCKMFLLLPLKNLSYLWVCLLCENRFNHLPSNFNWSIKISIDKRNKHNFFSLLSPLFFHCAAFTAEANLFWWFGHTWTHTQAHLHDNVSTLEEEMILNKEFSQVIFLYSTHHIFYICFYLFFLLESLSPFPLTIFCLNFTYFLLLVIFFLSFLFPHKYPFLSFYSSCKRCGFKTVKLVSFMDDFWWIRFFKNWFLSFSVNGSFNIYLYI